MRRKRPFYHLTETTNVESILRDGLVGRREPRNRGESIGKPSIFVLTEDGESLTERVALGQIWPFEDVEEYAVIEIQTAGISGKVRRDNVAEFTAWWQRIIEQERISPEHLRLAGTRKIDRQAILLPPGASPSPELLEKLRATQSMAESS